jgi:hypothetical protein
MRILAGAGRLRGRRRPAPQGTALEMPIAGPQKGRRARYAGRPVFPGRSCRAGPAAPSSGAGKRGAPVERATKPQWPLQAPAGAALARCGCNPARGIAKGGGRVGPRERLGTGSRPPQSPRDAPRRGGAPDSRWNGRRRARQGGAPGCTASRRAPAVRKRSCAGRRLRRAPQPFRPRRADAGAAPGLAVTAPAPAALLPARGPAALPFPRLN